MSKRLKLSQEKLCLPTIDLVDSSEQDFSSAFLQAAYVLHQQLEKIKSLVEEIEDFTRDQFNLAILSLFSKTIRSYYSSIILAVHHDSLGSELLIEQLCEAAITMTYLLENGDEFIFNEYTSASVHKACCLLAYTEEQLRKFHNHPDLLILKYKLETFVTEQQRSASKLKEREKSGRCLWGPQEADTTAMRGAIMRLDFLTNPARQIALEVEAASWLDLQLNYSNSYTNSFSAKEQPRIKFKDLRDASHLCLHAASVFLEELINYQDENLILTEGLQKELSLIYEWFYDAHKNYQLHNKVEKL